MTQAVLSTRNPRNAYNIVRDWNQLQGYTDAADETIQIRRSINERRVSIENSSTRPIAIMISTVPTVPSWREGPAIESVVAPDVNRPPPYGRGPKPLTPPMVPNFYLAGGEIKQVGINSFGGPMQYIHLLDAHTLLPVGAPYPFRTDCNQFVLRDGVNKWWVHAFQMRGFRG